MWKTTRGRVEQMSPFSKFMTISWRLWRDITRQHSPQLVVQTRDSVTGALGRDETRIMSESVRYDDWRNDKTMDESLTLWLPGRSACQDPDILYFSSFEAGIANAISSSKWRKIHKCSIYLTKICVILWLRSLTNDDGNFRHVWEWKG